MTELGSAGRRPPEPDLPEVSPAEARASRFSAANMVRSLAPLVLIVLLLVGWNAFRQNGTDPVHEIDPTSTVQLAAARAGYPLVVPTGLPKGYRPTSARTDAGQAKAGDPVTLQIGYVTPKEQYAGFVIGDDPRADALASVLDGAREEGTVQIGGSTWTRSRTARGETVLSQQSGKVTVLVTGSADDAELQAMAGAVRPYTP